MQEAAQPWEPHFVPRETVPETVRCLLSRKPTRLKQDKVIQQQQSPRGLSKVARGQGALFGRIKAAAITQAAEKEGQEPVGG